MRESLAASRSGIIAEFKRKSPSKGWIKEEGRADVITAAYAAAGAAALSILTDGKYFGGCLDYIRQARPMTDTPILRKEFIIDEYQLYQACQAGADTVLLIAAALTRPDYEHLTRKAHELGLEVLLEIRKRILRHGNFCVEFPFYMLVVNGSYDKKSCSDCFAAVFLSIVLQQFV